MPKKSLRTPLIWTACFVVVILLYNAFQRPEPPQRGWKVFADQLDAGEVAAVRFDPDDSSLIVTPHTGSASPSAGRSRSPSSRCVFGRG